jgi:ribonuclease-3
VAGRVLGSGDGRSKKEAEQHAAEAAWKTISAEATAAQQSAAAEPNKRA